MIRWPCRARKTGRGVGCTWIICLSSIGSPPCFQGYVDGSRVRCLVTMYYMVYKMHSLISVTFWGLFSLSLPLSLICDQWCDIPFNRVYISHIGPDSKRLALHEILKPFGVVELSYPIYNPFQYKNDCVSGTHYCIAHVFCLFVTNCKFSIHGFY